MKQFFKEDTTMLDQESPTIAGLDPTAGDGQDEISIGRLPDGTFVVMKNGEAVPVPDSVQRELQKEYDRQQQYREAVKQGQKPEDIKQKDQARFHVQSHNIGDTNRFKNQANREPYYKQNADARMKKLFDRGYFESTDVQKLTELLKEMIASFVSNQIIEAEEDEDRIRIDKSYLRPNRRQVLSDDSTAKGRRRVHYQPDEDEEDEEEDTERPLALVYCDRSGSFGTREKTKLGQDIVNLFESNYFINDEGKPLLDAQCYYFADAVSKSVSGVGGGTNLGKVIEHARQRTAGKLANIVIITDSDAESYADYEPLVVNGSVWLIYCNSAAPNFAKAFRLEGGESILEEFFFTQIN